MLRTFRYLILLILISAGYYLFISGHFNLLEKNDLDIIIQTLRKTKLISLFNFLTDKEVNFIRPEMKDYFKETISEIEEDYINFTKKLKKKIKNEELLRYF